METGVLKLSHPTLGEVDVPPSGGSLEIGNTVFQIQTLVTIKVRSPFGGIPRNWKRLQWAVRYVNLTSVPPSGGSLEIGNFPMWNGT